MFSEEIQGNSTQDNATGNEEKEVTLKMEVEEKIENDKEFVSLADVQNEVMEVNLSGASVEEPENAVKLLMEDILSQVVAMEEAHLVKDKTNGGEQGVSGQRVKTEEKVTGKLDKEPKLIAAIKREVDVEPVPPQLQQQQRIQLSFNIPKLPIIKKEPVVVIKEEPADKPKTGIIIINQAYII